MRKFWMSVVIGLALFSLPTAQAQTVLFSDDFEGRTNGSGDPNGNPDPTGSGGWGSNNNNLGGIITSMYSVGPERAGGRNQVVGLNAFDNSLGGNAFLFDGAAGVAVTGLTALSPDGFTVAFDFDRIADPNAAPGAGYLAFGLGLDNFSSLGNGAAIGRSAFGVLFQQPQPTTDPGGNMRTYAAGDTVTFDDNVNYGAPETLHSVLLTFTPTVSGSYGANALINFDVAVDGNSLSNGTFTSNGHDLDNIVFSANDPSFQARYIDNLVISSVTAIPEPSSLAALSCFGFATLLRRSRRSRR